MGPMRNILFDFINACLLEGSGNLTGPDTGKSSNPIKIPNQGMPFQVFVSI